MSHHYQMGKAIMACVIEDEVKACGTNRVKIGSTKVQD
jgi:hypothetical protein